MSLKRMICFVLGPQTWLKWRKEIEVLSGTGYFFLTTVLGTKKNHFRYVNNICFSVYLFK